MKSLFVICLTQLVVKSSALCFPEEPLADCVRRRQEERTKQPVQILARSAQEDDENSQDQGTQCLGVNNKEGFLGECKKSSSCAEVSSDSVNCLFSTVCCKKIVTVVGSKSILPGYRPSIDEVRNFRQYEDLNQENCGLRGNKSDRTRSHFLSDTFSFQIQ